MNTSHSLEAAGTPHALLVQRTIAFVREHCSTLDASHDWRHIERVWTLARALAKEEGVSDAGIEIIDLAALLHDIDDYKYQTGDAPMNYARSFLETQNVSSEKIGHVMDIVDNMGFKDELGSEGKREITTEFGCVQDADRLDAIGAIGIARCFTYGGHKTRPLYDPAVPPSETITQEQYVQQMSASINIFFAKLFKLRDGMKTHAGRRIATERHAFTSVFVEQFYRELVGSG